MNIANILAGLFSGIIASMGMGGGAVLLIYLTVFKNTNQLSAQGINLMFFIPIGLISIIIYVCQKKIQFKKIWLIVLFGVLGSFAGHWITNFLDKDIIAKIFAVFLIAMGLLEIFKKDKKGIENKAEK